MMSSPLSHSSTPTASNSQPQHHGSSAIMNSNHHHNNKNNNVTDKHASSTDDVYTTQWHDLNLKKFALLTTVFSTAENALFYPFYVLKTREQADHNVHRSSFANTKYHLQQLYNNKNMMRNLYRGFWISNCTSIPSYTIYMATYTYTKDLLLNSSSPSSSSSSSFAASIGVYSHFYAPFVAGLVADIASLVFYVPSDVVVQRLQLANTPYSSFSHACAAIYKHEGIKGFFRGMDATFITSGFASAIWWIIYENSKNYLVHIDSFKHQHNNSISSSANPPSALLSGTTTPSSSSSSSPSSSTPSSSSSSSHFSGLDTLSRVYAQLTEVNRLPQIAAGYIAGTLTSVIINPLDVVKTRLQVQDSFLYSQNLSNTSTASSTSSSSSSTKSSHRYYRSFFHGLKRIYRDEGVRGYFRGVVPKLISRGPLSAMSSLLYEMVLYLSRKEHHAP